MKKQSFLLSLCMLLALALGSCNSGSVLTQATGFAYEVVVVMDQANWEGDGGKAVKGDLGSAVSGLPQPEPCMKITYCEPKDFNGLMTYVRNILIVNIDETMYTKVSVGYEENRWARGQVVMSLKAPSAQAVATYLDEHPKVLSNFFVRVEMARAIDLLQETYSSVVMNTLKDKFGLMLNAPANIETYTDSTDFFWATNNAATGRTDLLVYTFPYTDANTFTPEYLVAKRDSVLKLHVPGSFPGSYMTTETRFGLLVDYKPIELNGKYCGVMRGLWRMEGDMMGGPFVSVARLDEQNNRVVVAEGFVYAPETDKRNFIRRIEAALYTLRLPDEVEGDFKNPMKL